MLSYYVFFSFCCSFFLVTFRRKVIKRIQDHVNPKVQGIARIPIHSLLSGFTSDIDARNFVMQPKCSPSFQEALMMLGRGTHGSTSHLVSCSIPYQWQLLNHGDPPISTNLPFENLFVDNPAGYYQCHFEIPAEWERRQIRMMFGGVGSAFYVWINGNFVGFSKDSKLSTEYNITQYSKIGRGNILELIVVKFSDASNLENHGSWKFSGIFREIYIMSLPQAVHIQDYNWIYRPETILDSKQNQVSLAVKIQLEWDAPSSSDSIQNQKHDYAYFQGGVYPRNNFLNSSAEWVVSTALYEEGVLMSSSPAENFESAQYFAFDGPKSKPAAKHHDYVFRPTQTSHDNLSNQSSHEERSQDDEPTLYSFTSLPEESSPVSKKWVSEMTHNLVIPSPKEWTAEKPFIYTLVIILRNATDGKIVQAESCRVAFRSVDVANGLLQVNSKPIMIRGTNILEYDCHSGYSIPHSLSELDIQLMKRNNINAIRTPPHDPWLYELCSLYGIYVINEVNIQPHFNSLTLVDDPDWETAYLTRLIRLYGRDKLHPSVIIWSLGNRSGYEKIHDKMADWIRATDPTRLVMYEPASYGARPISTNSLQNRILATDILCPMYGQISDLITLANRYPDHPLILSEYSLMTGNSGGNIEGYWTSFNEYRRLQGGFLSNWVDHDFFIQTQNSPFWTWSHNHNHHLKAINSQFFSGVNWHDRGQIREAVAVDNLHEPIPHGLVAQLPHSGFSRDRELQETGRIWVKPQLLEVKQCMKLFDCEVVEPTFSEGNDTTLFVTMKINISNLTDHLEDLSELLQFEIFLLSNGALISVTPFLKQSTKTVHHSGDAAGGRDYYQLLSGFCEFIVPLHNSVDGLRIFGIQWPEELLSISMSSSSLLERISDPSDQFHVSLNPVLIVDWKVVVLSRLVSHMCWGSAGLPLGFKQMKIEKMERLTWESQPHSLQGDRLEENHSVEIKWIEGEGLEPDILLSAELDKSSTRVEVVVSSQTGYLLAYRVNGDDILAKYENDDCALPSRYQLHRAPTAIDHKGYLSAWTVTGLDKEMHHVSHDGTNFSNPVAGTDVLGHSTLRLTQIDRISRQKDSLASSSIEQPGCGQGILCTWETTSDAIDRGKILILDKVQKFVNDSSSRRLMVEVRSNGQELFVFQLASLFRLGREIVLTKEEKLEAELTEDWNISSTNHQQSQPKDSMTILLWKITSFPTSSVPYLETHFSQPTGSLKYDEIDSYDAHLQWSQRSYDYDTDNDPIDFTNPPQSEKIEFNCRQYFTVKWKVSYMIDIQANLWIQGEVDITSLPCPPARIGLQLNLQSDFKSCSWFGNGPHENYQDRKASSVSAIHSAPCHSLHVPYSVPSENGGRSNTQWIEFAAPKKSLPRIRILCEPSCTFSAQNYSTEDLTRSLHSSDLPSVPHRHLCVNLDPYMMPLGSDDCWSIALSDKLLLTPSVYNFQFVITAVENN